MATAKVGFDLGAANLVLKEGLPEYKSQEVEVSNASDSIHMYWGATTLTCFFLNQAPFTQLTPLLKGRKVVVITVPGAFTPGCSKSHLPSFINNFDALKAKGVDEIICTATNDAHVMHFWGVQQGCDGKVRMLSDNAGGLVDLLGTVKQDGCQKRSERYTMVVDDGVVTSWHPGVGTDGVKQPENAWAPKVLESL